MDESNSSKVSMSSSTHREEMISKRRKQVFGDCALIEIIHLHDCLRGALRELESDVNALERVINSNSGHDEAQELERRVAGRFKVIWSVFKSHSQAEDEFIWPALKTKTQGKVSGSPKYSPTASTSEPPKNKEETEKVEQAEYEEDHADEERMFSEMDLLLTNLREVLLQVLQNKERRPELHTAVQTVARNLSQHTSHLSHHLLNHLEKEETQCMPLVVKHLSKSEIHDLVGSIMGKRSADLIVQIMNMAVQNLDDSDREEMVKYMKKSMEGTFFDRWLTMSGWNGNGKEATGKPSEVPGQDRKRPAIEPNVEVNKRVRENNNDNSDVVSQVTEASVLDQSGWLTTEPSGFSATNEEELKNLIRAVATNSALTPEQRNTTIQGLRDSIWRSNQRQKEMKSIPPTVVNVAVAAGPNFPAPPTLQPTESFGSGPFSATSRLRRVTPPSMYFKKSGDGKVELVWTCESPTASRPSSVPLFSTTELAPTYHDGAAGTVLGCPHYSRACKLRHPKSGRLYSCRMCCAQQRELPMSDPDEPLDRYAVTEVLCMKCNTLQPAEDRCFNKDCESGGKAFAKYFCKICHLYDDGSRPIFHCPYCNTCRLGKGLGIDFRHCMRCNACVSLSDKDHHCIPQSLQGSCPICHDSLFQSTKPLRGLKCGHVMHLPCFTEYRRNHKYTCPLCQRSMEDMSDYFALLDTAKRMQPMPQAYLSTLSNIYCQDCDKTGQTQYHFVGQKCPHCGSYNTRELGRTNNAS